MTARLLAAAAAAVLALTATAVAGDDPDLIFKRSTV